MHKTAGQVNIIYLPIKVVLAVCTYPTFRRELQNNTQHIGFFAGIRIFGPVLVASVYIMMLT